MEKGGVGAGLHHKPLSAPPVRAECLDRSKRPLSNSREMQSLRLPKALCRPRSKAHPSISTSMLTPMTGSNLGQSLADSANLAVHQQSQILPVKERVTESPFSEYMSGDNLGTAIAKKMLLPKLRLRDKLPPKDMDTNTHIFKHKIVRRTTVTSIKRTTILNSKTIKKKNSLETEIAFRDEM